MIIFYSFVEIPVLSCMLSIAFHTDFFFLASLCVLIFDPPVLNFFICKGDREKESEQNFVPFLQGYFSIKFYTMRKTFSSIALSVVFLMGALEICEEDL